MDGDDEGPLIRGRSPGQPPSDLGQQILPAHQDRRTGTEQQDPLGPQRGGKVLVDLDRGGAADHSPLETDEGTGRPGLGHRGRAGHAVRGQRG